MSSENKKLGMVKARAMKTTGGLTIHESLDPALVSEDAWKEGLPPAKFFVDSETGEQVPKPVVNPIGKGSDVPPALEQHVLELYGEGVPAAQLEAKFELSRGYVHYALRRRFGSEEAYRAALKKLLLETGIATAQHTLANVDSLHPSQSGMVSVAMTNAYLAMAKHEKDVPKQVDFAALASFGETLARLEQFAGITPVPSEDSSTQESEQ